jgi:hypothetical protein
LRALPEMYPSGENGSATKESAMTDDKTKRGPPDTQRINVNEQYEVSYWTKALGVSEQKLRDAVRAVGVSVAAVRRHLGK